MNQFGLFLNKEDVLVFGGCEQQNSLYRECKIPFFMLIQFSNERDGN